MARKESGSAVLINWILGVFLLVFCLGMLSQVISVDARTFVFSASQPQQNGSENEVFLPFILNGSGTNGNSEFTLTINIVGQGTVNKSPDKSVYQAGESVYLTATPASNWSFVGWSGDHSGFQIQQTIILNGSKNITATFIQSTRYFVSTSGNDLNPGTQSQPWRTIGNAARMVKAGDIVYVRGGVYAEQVILSKSGSQDKPILFLAYNNETPVMDGSGLSIPNGSSLLHLAGNWIVVSGFEVRYSRYMGIDLSGQHNVVDNVFSHENRETGILARGDYSTVENSRIWRNALNNEYGAQSGGGWASGLSAARDHVDGKTDYAVLRNNTSWENWGEGVSSFEANGTLIEGNISHDNYSANIYISDTTNALCQRNFVYRTPGNYVNSGAHVGIMLGDEVYRPSSANNTIINNIAYGNKRNFFWWQGNRGGGLVNVLIANNTFVNSTMEAGVVINQGSHQNARFINNIIMQEGSLPAASIDLNAQLQVNHNLWSKKPNGAANGTGDVVGDPLFVKAASVYTAEWYPVTEGSPAINKALPLPQVTVDYEGTPRGSAPDMGALEN